LYVCTYVRMYLYVQMNMGRKGYDTPREERLAGVMSSTPKEDSDCRDHTPSTSKYPYVPAAALPLFGLIPESAGAPSRISSPAPCAAADIISCPEVRAQRTRERMRETERARARACAREIESENESDRASERKRERESIVRRRASERVREHSGSAPRESNAPYCRPESHRGCRCVHRAWRGPSCAPLPLSEAAKCQCLPRTRGALH